MMSLAAANIFRKALALKPDGLEGVLNSLDPEEQNLNNLSGRLSRRRKYLQELSTALNSAPQNLFTQSLTRMVHPLEETVSKIQNWLNSAKSGLAGLNKAVKHQNILLANAIAEFAQRNRLHIKGGVEKAKKSLVPVSKDTKVSFVKAAA